MDFQSLRFGFILVQSMSIPYTFQAVLIRLLIRGVPLYYAHLCSPASNPDMSFFAFADTDLKFLVGKEKRTLQILSFVRSKESTKKGDVPPRNM